MPTCCSTSSRAGAGNDPPSSPPTGRSPSGARPSPTPPASSPWSTASSTTPRSSPSTAIPIAARRPRNARRYAAPSAAAGEPESPAPWTAGNRRQRNRGRSSFMAPVAGRGPARLSPRRRRTPSATAATPPAPRVEPNRPRRRTPETCPPSPSPRLRSPPFPRRPRQNAENDHLSALLNGAYILSLTDRFAGCRGPVLVAMRLPKSGFSGHGPLCYVRTD